MAGHPLGVLKPSVVLQVDRDTGRPPSVTSDGGEKTAALARFRVAVQALYRLRARPIKLGGHRVYTFDLLQLMARTFVIYRSKSEKRNRESY